MNCNKCNAAAEYTCDSFSFARHYCRACILSFDGLSCKSNDGHSLQFDTTVIESHGELIATERVSLHHYGHLTPHHTNVFAFRPIA
jgi:hypothetical protein